MFSIQNIIQAFFILALFIIAIFYLLVAYSIKRAKDQTKVPVSLYGNILILATFFIIFFSIVFIFLSANFLESRI